MKIGILANRREWKDRGRYVGYAHFAIAEGLKNIGHGPIVVDDTKFTPEDGAVAQLFPGGIDMAFIWNAPEQNQRAHIRDELRGSGIPVLIVEHGFLQRRTHVQIDHKSFSHLASWASASFFDSRLPVDATQRLREVYPDSIPIKARPGYILILLQNTGSVVPLHLRGLEIRQPGPLIAAVEEATPEDVTIRAREHPLDKWSCDRGRTRMTEGTLAEDVAGAAFCVTINTTAGIEVSMMGCPVLSLGPSLYAMAGVSLVSSKETLREGIAKMLAGWYPEPLRVLNFFSHLACRQWGFDELAQGDVLKPLLRAAGGSQ